MAGGYAKCLKCLLFAANLIIMVCGIAVIAAGAWAMADTDILPPMLAGKSFFTCAYVIIALGVFIVFVSFLGCCGAIKENKCMLIMFFLILLVIFILLIAAAAVVYISRDKVETSIRADLKASISNYGTDKSVTQAWDVVQKKLECCGMSQGYNQSYSIWAGNKYLQDKEKVVPDSCCKDVSPAAIKTCQSDPQTNTYSEDCVHKMKDTLKESALLLAAIGIGVACVLVIGMMLSCGLYLMIGQKSKPTRSTPTRSTPTSSTPTSSTPTKSTPTKSTPTRSTPPPKK